MADEKVYIAPTIETDEDELADLGMEYLEGQVPGWEPHGGNLDVWIIEAVAFMAARIATMTGDVPATIFRWFGTELMNLPPKEATPATAQSVWTVQPGNVAEENYIDDGRQVTISDQTFAVSGDYTIPAGASSISGVVLLAVEEGAAGSGLTDDPELVNLLPWVASITLSEQTTGGQDGEGNDDYLDRLSNLLRLMGPKVVLPRDVEEFAKQVDGVGRALALDLYDPTANNGSGAWNVAKTLTVALATENGEAVGQTVKDSVVELLKENREVNFRFFVRDPDFNTVSVEYDAVAFRDFDPSVVQANGSAAILAYLDPSTWGSPNFGDGGTDLWTRQSKVRFGELYAVLNGVEGLDYVNWIKISINGGAYVQNQDLDLVGIAPLTQPQSVSGTVTKPVN